MSEPRSNRFVWKPGDAKLFLSQCTLCRHYDRNTGRCAAFTGSIPDEIGVNDHDHRHPYPGDHGIRWEPKTPGTRHPMDEHNEPKA